MNSTVSPSLIRIVKTEPGIIIDSSRELVEQKEEYEQKMNRLQKNHDEQIYKLCYELEKSSLLIHQFKLELDSMRLKLNQKENQLTQSSIQDLENKNIELTTENTKLKIQLTELTSKYQILFNEMQDARQYLLSMIDKLD
jgi:chromosome segregation ATPase